jgi:hypothetical protein
MAALAGLFPLTSLFAPRFSAPSFTERVAATVPTYTKSGLRKAVPNRGCRRTKRPRKNGPTRVKAAQRAKHRRRIAA